ncbi:Malate permease [Bombilactobacillus mellifer]|uniref:Malate permease n=1 Tax=Bombilactobacillus mellifer TaxID=1218492 RepID=A0A0F4LTQ6_9LACO|nr:AEC family transporter [Bombilactobacillus mellifer]KJY61990.1 Malate permease [Bombilactobacillus mellifer]MCT6844434.1 AEC family transporter [Bombilactobacillus mellifer]MCT6894868.1 AEC family transporter [Bombilactobacillus mellifer]
MDISQALFKTFTDMNIISSITSTLFIILLGFFLRKKNIFSDQFGKMMTKIVLSVSLPALAFNSFMAPIDDQTLKHGLAVLIFGILIYIILIFVSKLFYLGYDHDRQTVLSVLTTFGSTTFFGMPIVAAIYGPKGTMYASIFNIGYRIFLYSYAYIVMSGLKMTKKNIRQMFLNPVVLATFLGLILWIIQPYMPTLTGLNPETHKAVTVAFYRIDVTAPWLFKPLTYLASLSSPLAWLAIGSTLGEISFKSAAKNKTSWYYTAIKTIVVPAINLALLFVLTVTKILPVSQVAMATILIMMATPTAAVAASYAIGFDREAVLTSNASFISTIGAVIMVPIWIVIISLIGSAGIF